VGRTITASYFPLCTSGIFNDPSSLISAALNTPESRHIFYKHEKDANSVIEAKFRLNGRLTA